MPLPTKADIEFFKEAKRIQELWEPKFGDWVLEQGVEAWLAVVSDYDEEDDDICIEYKHFIAPHQKGDWKDREELIFLPRQGQLQEMLEERGYSSQLVVKPDVCLVNIWGEDLAGRFDEGPTPSIALGRALIEVLDGEKED